MTDQAMRGLATAIVALLAIACSDEPMENTSGTTAGTTAAAGTGAAGTMATAGTGPDTATAGTGAAGTMATAGTGAAGTMATAGTGAAGTMATAGTGAAGTMATAGTGAAGTMATAGTGAAGTMATAGTGATGGPMLMPADSVTEDGPYTPMVEEEIDGGDGWLFRPSTLGEGGTKHPVFVWGCGSGSTPRDYMFHLSRIASHGFVVYAADTDSVTGARLTQGLDWVFAANDDTSSDLHQQLDLTNVGVGGHSLGSLSTYQIADDPRLTMTVHVDGGTFDATGGAALVKPAIFICGDNSTGTPYCNQDYEDANVPIFYTRLEGLSGIQGHIQAAREGIDVWVAWLRWQLGREEERRSDFLDPSCTFCTGKYDSQSKNW